jgi:exportin-T
VHSFIKKTQINIFCSTGLLTSLFVFIQAKDMVEFLVLINQIICKFNSSASGILEDVFPTIASHLSVILSQDAFSTGPAGNTEVKLITSRSVAFLFLHFSQILVLVFVSDPKMPSTSVF